MKIKYLINRNKISSVNKLFSSFSWGKNLEDDVKEFKKTAKITIDYIAEKHKNINKMPITNHKEPGFLDKLIPNKMPDEGRDYEDVLKDIDKNIINNYTLYNHPGFFADTSMTSYPAIIGNFVSDAFNNPGVSWVANPAGFELERIVLEWMADEFALPEVFKKVEAGCCVHLEVGESAAVVALAARTKKRTEYKDQDEKFTYYYSSQANKAASKSIYIANGIKREIPVVWNESIKNYEMDVNALESQVKDDIKSGLIPTLIYTSLGNFSTTAYDNIERISNFSSKNKIWCHVDAGILGNLLMLKEKRELYSKGLSNVNSIVIEGNKALPFGLDSAFFYVDEAKYVFKALNEDFVLYVQFFKDNQAEMTNYHFGTARATKSIRLWMVIKSFGTDGLRQLLQKQIKMANLMEDKILKVPNFKKFVKSNFNSVMFLLNNNEEVDKFVDFVNKEGKLYITSGEIKEDSKKFVKLCINDIYINESRVNEVVEILTSSYKNCFNSK